MNAEIIAVGTEILLGQIVNTNAKYISERLSEVGINVYFQTVVGDNPMRLTSAFKLGFERADILIVTGGLGPTADDLTKETAAKLMGKELVLDKQSLEGIKNYFEKSCRQMTENNIKQAMMPKDCRILKNNNGTAPGCIMEKKGKYIILLPGPPREMKPMFDESVFPFLQELCPDRLYSKVLRIFGVGESRLEDMLGDMMNQDLPTIAPYAKEGEVTLRITARAKNRELAEKIIGPTEQKIREMTGNAVYAIGDDMSMEKAVGDMLIKENISIAVAESCTGGMISDMLVSVPGISAVFKEGRVTYTNDAKIRMGVNEKTIKEYGAVSMQTAMEMAQSIKNLSGADLGISTTGNAGPDCSEGKPAGLVYIGFASENGSFALEFQFVGNRERIRRNASLNALNVIRSNVNK